MNGKPAAIMAYRHEQGLTYPCVVDTDTEVAGKFRIRGIPTAVLVDRQGTIRYQGNELPTHAQIESALK